MSAKNPYNAYRETNIKTASQGKLIVMLYDEALKQLAFSVKELGQPKPKLDAVNNAVTKAQDVITELTVSLDFEKGGEIAENLFSLYMFFNQTLREANIKKDPEPMGRVRNMMAELRAAWVEASKKSGLDQPGSATGVNIAG